MDVHLILEHLNIFLKMSHLIMGCFMHVDESRLCSQVVSVSAVQRLSAEDPSGHKPFRTRNGYREGQHRLQLRHARGLRHVSPQGTYPRLRTCFRSLKWHVSHGLVPFSGGSCGALRHQGFGRHIRVRRDRCKDPERCAGPIRGQRVRVTRGDRHFHLQ